MFVALVHRARFPIKKYGGTERVVWWLAKGLSESGVRVVLIADKGSECPFADVVTVDFSKPLEPQIPKVDFVHYFSTPPEPPALPYLVTIEGNAKPGEVFLPNTVFASQNHAERHNAESFVYNGVDPSDYSFSERKDSYLVFLAKASWKVKNVKGAIGICRRAKQELQILGGQRIWCPHWRGVHWRGMVDQEEKRRWLTKARALLFPVLWEEPFGIAVIEALVSGTPVLATPYGSLPELVPSHVGRLCRSTDAFVNALNEITTLSPKDCRDWALSRFHYLQMTRNYLQYYERVQKGDSINKSPPRYTPRSQEPLKKF